MAGPSKRALLEELINRAKSGGDDLAMDHLSRMARAREQGFDTSQPYYRGTTNDEEIGGMFLTKDPEYASSYTTGAQTGSESKYLQGGNVTKRFIKGEPVNIADDPQLMDEFKAFVDYDAMTPWQKEDILTKDGNLNFQAADKAREFLKSKDIPHNSIVIDEANGNMAVKVYDPSLQRSVNADFDPLEKDSSNLLASGLAGTAIAGGLLAPEEAEAGVITKGGKRFIESWHGTPHDFPPTADNPLGAFDNTKMGTGEGAQAFGHGAYTADARGTAEGYRDALEYGTRERQIASKLGVPESYETKLFSDQLRANNGDVKKTRDWMANYAESMDDADSRNALRGMVDRIDDRFPAGGGIIDVKDNPGSLYKVHIDATPEELLDWDKPLSEQSEIVKDFIKSSKGSDWYSELVDDQMGGPLMDQATGRDLYKKIEKHQGAENINLGGIKGIQYNDAMSRGVDGGSGTKNYVTFDDKLMNIVDKYGVAGLGGALGGALYTPEQNAAMAGDLVRSGVEDYGSITPDEYPFLQQAGDFIEKWTQTPLGSPAEGLAEYLRGFGQDDDTQAKAERAFWAAMDMI